MNSKTDKDDRSCDDIAFLSEIIADFRYWHPLKGPCQEKILHHRKKLIFFLQGQHPGTGSAPFRCLRP